MILINNYMHTTFKYPAGELQVKVSKMENVSTHTSIEFKYTDQDSIFELLLACNAIKHCGDDISSLHIGYFPYGRQDRVANDGESFSLEVIAQLINSIGAKKVFIKDPHSDVIPALINNSVVIHQHNILKNLLTYKKDFYLISPDGGALKKIYKLAKEVNCIGVIECSKLRDTRTGDIIASRVYCDDLDKKDCYIVDDICDGGRTFIEIAKELRKIRCGKIYLVVTHGLFTKGVKCILEHIDEIITPNGNIVDSTEDLM